MANTIGEAYINILPSTKDFGSSLSKSLGDFGTMAAGAVAGASAAVVGFTEKAVESGMAFDKSMSQVAATMGFSAEELNTYGSTAQQTFEQLSAFAQEMGSTTAFSASEAADALNYMALAGYDAETSMNMLPTVLNLAAAGGIDLASASDMVTDAQSALGLSIEETTEMVDKMAMAASKSNTSVAQLGEAYLTVGANAKVLDGGTTELSTALGILADNGIKGAEGGTHLRNILLSMNPTTKSATEAWKALGVSAYDAEGNLRPLEDVFADLNEAMDGMSTQDRQNMISAMFNKTDLASVNALLDTNAGRWDELSTAIDNSKDSAEEMASVQLDNLAGDITLFQSAFEGFQIAISDQVTPSLREFVQFGSDGLSRLTEAFNTGGLDGAMSELGTIISEGLESVINSLPDAIEAGSELLGSIGQGIIDNLPEIVDVALEIALKLVESLIEAAPQLLESAIVIISELANGLSEQLPTLIPSMVDAVITLVMALIDNIDMLIDSAIILMVALADGLIEAIPKLLEKAPEIIQKLVAALTEEIPVLVVAALDLMMGLAGGLIDALPEVITMIPEIIAGIRDGLLEGVAEFLVVGNNLIEGLWNGISEKSDWIIEKIKSFGEDVLNGLKSFFGIASPSKVMRDEIGKFLPEGMAVGIEANADAVTDAMDSIAYKTLETGVNITGNIADYSMPASSDISTNSAYELLAQYLPIIASNQPQITLEGDAGKLFNVIQKQSKIYNNQFGKPAFA